MGRDFLLLGFIRFLCILLAEHINLNVYVFSLLYLISLAVKDFSDSFLMCFEYHLYNSIYFLGIWLQTLEALFLRKSVDLFLILVFHHTLAFLLGTRDFD